MSNFGGIPGRAMNTPKIQSAGRSLFFICESGYSRRREDVNTKTLCI